MDPVSATLSFTAILASVTSLTLNTHEIILRAKQSNSALVSQLDEIQVLRDVLEECYEIIEAARKPKLPTPVDHALQVCEMRSAQLEIVFASAVHVILDSNKPIARLRKVKTLMLTENQRKAAFKGFRSAVLLLRDLCSEIRLQHQLVHMSATLAELMADRYDEAALLPIDVPEPNHIYFDGEVNPTGDVEKDQTVSSLTHRTKFKGKVGYQWTDLIRQNFTRNATIVINNDIDDRPRRITVRAKMDTGCNDNLITLELFKKFGIDKSMLIQIPEEDHFELEMLEGVKCTIMFAQEFAEQIQPSLIIAKKRKNKDDHTKILNDHAIHLKQEKLLEVQERNAQQSMAAQKWLQGQATLIAQQASQSHVIPAQAPLVAPQTQISSSQMSAPITSNRPNQLVALASLSNAATINANTLSFPSTNVSGSQTQHTTVGIGQASKQSVTQVLAPIAPNTTQSSVHPQSLTATVPATSSASVQSSGQNPNAAPTTSHSASVSVLNTVHQPVPISRPVTPAPNQAAGNATTPSTPANILQINGSPSSSGSASIQSSAVLSTSAPSSVSTPSKPASVQQVTAASPVKVTATAKKHGKISTFFMKLK